MQSASELRPALHRQVAAGESSAQRSGVDPLQVVVGELVPATATRSIWDSRANASARRLGVADL